MTYSDRSLLHGNPTYAKHTDHTSHSRCGSVGGVWGGSNEGVVTCLGLVGGVLFDSREEWGRFGLCLLVELREFVIFSVI